MDQNDNNDDDDKNNNNNNSNHLLTLIFARFPLFVLHTRFLDQVGTLGCCPTEPWGLPKRKQSRGNVVVSSEHISSTPEASR